MPPSNVRNQLLDLINNFIALISPFGDDWSFDTLNIVINQFRAFLKALYTYMTSLSFPNVNFAAIDHNFYQLTFYDIVTSLPTNGLIWKSIPAMPTVFFNQYGLYERSPYDKIEPIKARQILNNIQGGSVGEVRWGVRGLPVLMPFPNAVRYTRRGFEYHSGYGFYPVEMNNVGDLRLVQKQILQYQEGENGKVWQGITLPRRADDLHAGSPMPIGEGVTKAIANGTGLDVFINGQWQSWAF